MSSQGSGRDDYQEDEMQGVRRIHIDDTEPEFLIIDSQIDAVPGAGLRATLAYTLPMGLGSASTTIHIQAIRVQQNDTFDNMSDEDDFTQSCASTRNIPMTAENNQQHTDIQTVGAQPTDTFDDMSEEDDFTQSSASNPDIPMSEENDQLHTDIEKEGDQSIDTFDNMNEEDDFTQTSASDPNIPMSEDNDQPHTDIEGIQPNDTFDNTSEEDDFTQSSVSTPNIQMTAENDQPQPAYDFPDNYGQSIESAVAQTPETFVDMGNGPGTTNTLAQTEVNSMGETRQSQSHLPSGNALGTSEREAAPPVYSDVDDKESITDEPEDGADTDTDSLYL